MSSPKQKESASPSPLVEISRKAVSGTPGLFKRCQAPAKDAPLLQFRSGSAAISVLDTDAFSAVSGAPWVVSLASGASVTGSIAAGFLQDKLELPLLAHGSWDGALSRVVVAGSQPALSLRLHGTRDLVVVSSDVKIANERTTIEVVQAILQAARAARASMIVAVEGVPRETGPGADSIDYLQLHYLTSCPRFATWASGTGFAPFTDGVIGGTNGAFVAEFMAGPAVPVAAGDAASAELQFSLIMAPTNPLFPDVRSAHSAVTAIVDFFGLHSKIDVRELESKAQSIESKVSPLLRQHYEREAMMRQREMPASSTGDFASFYS